MKNDNIGCGCIIVGLICAFILSGIRKCVSATPDIMKAYGEALDGPYGGLWGLPLLILIIFAIAYFQDRNSN